MAFVKDTSYREMPFSSESPSPNDFNCFVTVKNLTLKRRRVSFQCRTIGIIKCNFDGIYITEIDDDSVQIRLSLTTAVQLPKFTSRPYTAQLFGLVIWTDELVMYPHFVQDMQPPLAIKLWEAMQLINDLHRPTNKRPLNPLELARRSE